MVPFSQLLALAQPALAPQLVARLVALAQLALAVQLVARLVALAQLALAPQLVARLIALAQLALAPPLVAQQQLELLWRPLFLQVQLRARLEFQLELPRHFALL